MTPTTRSWPGFFFFCQALQQYLKKTYCKQGLLACLVSLTLPGLATNNDGSIYIGRQRQKHRIKSKHAEDRLKAKIVTESQIKGALASEVAHADVYVYTNAIVFTMETAMATSSQGRLVRKQYLVSESNIEKLELLANTRGASAAEIVRQAIDAYDPHGAETMDAPELMDLVSEKLKGAIKSTRDANRRVSKTLKVLEREDG